MANKVLVAFLGTEMLFLLAAGLLIAFPLMMHARMELPPTVDTVVEDLLLQRCPMTGLPHHGTYSSNHFINTSNLAAIANAVIMFVTFLTTIPAVLMPTSRLWLKLQGYLVFVCAVMSMIIGLVLWYDTLRTRSNLSTVWALQTQQVQSMLQQKVGID